MGYAPRSYTRICRLSAEPGKRRQRKQARHNADTSEAKRREDCPAQGPCQKNGNDVTTGGTSREAK